MWGLSTNVILFGFVHLRHSSFGSNFKELLILLVAFLACEHSGNWGKDD